MNSIAKNNIDTLNAERTLNIRIARALTDDDVMMNAVDLTANNAEQRPQDEAEIADVIRGIVATLVAAATGPSSNPMGHPIAQIIDEADVCYDPDEIAAEVAWYVTLI